MTKTATESAIECAKALKTYEEQREMFLWKYRDVDRAECNELLKVNATLNTLHDCLLTNG